MLIRYFGGVRWEIPMDGVLFSRHGFRYMFVMTRGPYVETEVSFELGCSCAEAFALMSDMKRFPSFFTGYGPIPPVVRCELLTSAPVQVGSKRLITNGDGSVLEELVQVYKVDHEQLYRIEKGFVAPFSWMVCAAEGHWQFKPSEEGTS